MKPKTERKRKLTDVFRLKDLLSLKIPAMRSEYGYDGWLHDWAEDLSGVWLAKKRDAFELVIEFRSPGINYEVWVIDRSQGTYDLDERVRVTKIRTIADAKELAEGIADQLLHERDYA